MTNPVLVVSNVGKAYKHYSSEFSRILSWFNVATQPAHETWVLQNVSFSVAPGEAVGILGKNGAGKSTLLKLITGTQHPTTGEIHTSGRIGAILELGMGFNSEFTGRQNIYHSAGLMGFSHAEIEHTIADIESFADIGDYFDQTVGIYSSGMTMRLAFSLATSFQPQLLIVDEALSVGDAAFQRKCFRRLEKYISDGMSLLLVSHDVEGIKKICSKALLLKDGFQESFGDSKVIGEEYEKQLFSTGISKQEVSLKNNISPDKTQSLIDPALVVADELSYGDGRAELTAVWLEDEENRTVNIVTAETKTFYIKTKVHFHAPIRNPVIAFLIKTTEGIAIYGTDTEIIEYENKDYDKGDEAIFTFVINNYLAPGIYFLNCAIKDQNNDEAIFIHRRVDAMIFRVQPSSPQKSYVGLTNLDCRFTVSTRMNSK
ncbi:MAG: ABC transporter ATP-binding protein [Cyanobacteria bacterium P01_B01_bin.77]